MGPVLFFFFGGAHIFARFSPNHESMPESLPALKISPEGLYILF